jgi:hypothetical protein
MEPVSSKPSDAKNFGVASRFFWKICLVLLYEVCIWVLSIKYGALRVANGWRGRQLSTLNTYIAGCQKHRPLAARLCRGNYNSAHAWAWYFLKPLCLSVYLSLFIAYVTKPSDASRLWQNRTELHEQRSQDRFWWTQHSAGLLSIPYCNTRTSFVKRSARIWTLL